MADADEHAPTVGSPSTPSLARARDARFLPGTILARRYRIVAPLGRGGMGEVYRADDLKLGQTVALKFLPPEFERDADRLAMLLDEVKLAREISHPNVCRVWDVAESDGLHFIAMEFVDGEDLGAVLRRIGRLPEERALQVAGEVCAGLAAIHGQGLLHRDIKPSNLMLDGRGRVRITDFGLATLAAAADGAQARMGTPAYMAPEQLEGREVTVRSDIYALGLVLYEVFTGRHAFGSGRDPRTPVSEARPETPSSHLRGLDPTIERAILRCLEPDPAARPASASMVARALPGGDPLEAARLAGETPSPEMVAAAGGVGGMRPLAALGCVAISLLGLVGAMVLSDLRGLPFGPEDKPYQALRDRAIELVRQLGFETPGGTTLDGIDRLSGPSRITTAAPDEAYYWYRHSDTAILPLRNEAKKYFDFDIPAVVDPGEVAVRFDLQGRLIELRRVPSRADSGRSAADLSPLFAAARIDTTTLQPIEPVPPPPVASETRRAWVVPRGGRADTVLAATFGGRATFFSVGRPKPGLRLTLANLIVSTVVDGLLLLLFFLSVAFARRNLRGGRADLRGAVRVGIAGVPLGLFGYLLFQHHIPLGSQLVIHILVILFYCAFTATSYLALEPLVRRHHPAWLTSWTRLIDGRWLDPLVGRDVLLGAAAGAVMGLFGGVRGLVEHSMARGDIQAAAIGGTTAVALALRGLGSGIFFPLLLVMVLALLQSGLRRNGIAWAVWFALGSLLISGGFGPIAILAAVITFALWYVTLQRAGILGGMVAFSVFFTLSDEFVTTHLGAWYAGVTISTLIMVGVMLAWGWIAARRGAERLSA